MNTGKYEKSIITSKKGELVYNSVHRQLLLDEGLEGIERRESLENMTTD